MDSYVENVKLYVYKPFLDAENVADGKTVDDYAQQMYYSYDSMKAGALTNVKIHVAKANANTNDMTIFTNLDITDNADASQFHVSADKFTSFATVVSDNGTYSTSNKVDFNRSLIKTIEQDTRHNDRLRTVTVTMLPVSVSSTVDTNGITQITETVRKDANTVTLTGAKGEK